MGKLKEDYWRGAVAEYSKRLSGYCALKIIETPDERITSPADEERVKQKETAGVLAKISRRDFVIVLDVGGIPQSSEGFSELLSAQMLRGVSVFTFLIGGSLGFSREILARADYRLSMSGMTFPHQMMRVILLEQLYRAFKIARGETYHK